MPLPAEDTVEANAPAGPSTSSARPLPSEATTDEVLSKFKQLGVDARAEGEEGEGEGEEDDEEEGDEEGAGMQAVDDQGGAGAAGKKKKKKKKGKASKAVQKLKELATGEAPQELVDQIRGNMEPGEQGAHDGMSDLQRSSAIADLGNPRHIRQTVRLRQAGAALSACNRHRICEIVLTRPEDIRKALKAVDLMKILDGQVAMGNKSNSKIIGEHKFWKTQPVPQSLSGPSSVPAAIEEGAIDPLKTPQEVKQEPGTLPSGFVWSLVDITNDAQCEEVHTLLSENYVEDDDAMFRFRYSKEFLLWSLTAPGYHPDWHIGVRVQKTGKLVAFISGILVDIRVRAKTFPAAEINFLCVHKKLRSKRLTPVLIKEVTRRVNLADVWQAIYTAGIVLPTPIGTCRYYHRNLNPPKLVDIGFSPVPRGMTVARLVKRLAVPTTLAVPGFREMTESDVPKVADLLRRYLARFEVTQEFNTDDEVKHWFLSGRGKKGGEGGAIAGNEGDEGGEEGKGWRREGQVVWAYVVEDPNTHRITDLVSFYSLPSSIMKHPTHKVLNAAYMYYYATDVVLAPDVSTSSASTSSAVVTGDIGGSRERRERAKLSERLNALVGDMMVVAKNAGFDVFNALTLMDNNLFLTDQKFGAGDGFLVSPKQGLALLIESLVMGYG